MAYFWLSLAFGCGFLLIFGVNLLLADVFKTHREKARTRLEEDLRLQNQERARSSMAYKDLYEMAADGMVDVRERVTLSERFVKLVDQSGTTIRPGQLAMACVGVAIVAAVAVGLLSGSWVAAAVLAPVGGVLPAIYVSYLRVKRSDKLLSQLPDAFDLMSRTMRAGQTASQALQAVADEFTAPIADEFGYCYDQQNLGLSAEAAMRDLSRRTGLLELKIFVLAVMIHRQTGGNLSELLEKLSTVIRERYRIVGQIKSLTAEGRLQAIILLALPPGMLAIMLFLNRPYIMVLFEQPLLLAMMFSSMAFGAFWMRRIINFDF
jgi:tight adherence protein B